MRSILKLIAWIIILISAIFIGNDMFHIASSMTGRKYIDANEVYFRIMSLLISIVVIYIFWNMYQFILRKNYRYIKYIGFGLVLEVALTGLSLFLPQDLYQMMKSSNFSDSQISLTYYLAYTPGSIAGGILGLFLIFLAMEEEKRTYTRNDEN